MMSLAYWFYPNLGTAPYSNPKVLTALLVSVGLIVASIIFMSLRKRLSNSVTKKLTASWPTAGILFGLIGLILAVSRAEGIQFFSMRVLWLIWVICFAIFVILQIISFKRRHYTVLKREKVKDERDRYLPKKKN